MLAGAAAAGSPTAAVPAGTAAVDIAGWLAAGRAAGLALDSLRHQAASSPSSA